MSEEALAQADACLDRWRKTATIFPWTRLAVTADGSVDDLGIAPCNRGVIQSIKIECSRPEIFDDHISLIC